jgi:hypothetical protein
MSAETAHHASTYFQVIARCDTVLQIFVHTRLLPIETPHIVGVEDWAKKTRVQDTKLLADVQ